MTCALDVCDGTGVVRTTDWTGDDVEVCPCSFGQDRITAGLLLAARLEAEARYYPTRLADVGKVAHKLRVALGMIPQ